MIELLVMRHGKARDQATSGGDHARELTQRGHDESRAIGRQLAARRLVPDIVLCSDSERTRQSAAAVADGANLAHGERLELPELYLADRRTLLDAVKIYAADRSVVLIIAHNPGVEDLVSVASGNDLRMKTAWLARVRLDPARTTLDFVELIKPDPQ